MPDDEDRQVAATEVEGLVEGLFVSTVRLDADLWETRVFGADPGSNVGAELGGLQYTTREAAQAGHDRVVAAIRERGERGARAMFDIDEES